MSLQTEFSRLTNEVNNYFIFLGRIINDEANGDGKNPYYTDLDVIEMTNMHNSQCVLMLYNLLEGTIHLCLQELIDKVNEEKMPYSEASLAIQTIYKKINYPNYKVKESAKDLYELAEDIKKLSEINSVIIAFQYDSKQKNEQKKTVKRTQLKDLGNLNTDNIRSVFTLFGIDYPIINDSDYTLNIKDLVNFRNLLAHGEVTFADLGRRKSFQEYLEMKNKIIIPYLELVVEAFVNYIENKKYKVRITKKPKQLIRFNKPHLLQRKNRRHGTRR